MKKRLVINKFPRRKKGKPLASAADLPMCTRYNYSSTLQDDFEVITTTSDRSA
jgi:hypothetical protein